MVGTAGAALGLAHSAGADVSLDPDSSDFGKIKVGNTRVDPLGNFGPYARLAAKTMSYYAGHSKEGGDIEKFFWNKTAPVVQMAYEGLKGKDVLGRPIAPYEIPKDFLPIFLRDAKDIIQDPTNNFATKVGQGTASLFGLPVQTFGQKKSSGGRSNSMFPQVKLPSTTSGFKFAKYR
jgi:hypothetical protein